MRSMESATPVRFGPATLWLGWARARTNSAPAGFEPGQQRGSGPENRSLAVQGARAPLAREVITEIVLLVRAFANVAQGLAYTTRPKKGLAGGRALTEDGALRCSAGTGQGIKRRERHEGILAGLLPGASAGRDRVG